MAAAVCLLLAGTLAWAGVAKLADPAPFRVTLRSLAAAENRSLDEALLDEVCRPERFVTRLEPMFERLEKLA